MRNIDKTDWEALLDGGRLHPLTSEGLDLHAYAEQEGIDLDDMFDVCATMAFTLGKGMAEGEEGKRTRGLLRMMLIMDEGFLSSLISSYMAAVTMGWEAHKRAEAERRPGL